jgi:hypothetical protein
MLVPCMLGTSAASEHGAHHASMGKPQHGQTLAPTFIVSWETHSTVHAAVAANMRRWAPSTASATIEPSIPAGRRADASPSTYKLRISDAPGFPGITGNQFRNWYQCCCNPGPRRAPRAPWCAVARCPGRSQKETEDVVYHSAAAIDQCNQCLINAPGLVDCTSGLHFGCSR